MIYFSDYLEFDPPSAAPSEIAVPVTPKPDNVINFPSSASPTEEEISKWVDLLVHQTDEAPYPAHRSSEDMIDDDPLNVLAEALLDKGVL
jgi:hypothetical protein